MTEQLKPQVKVKGVTVKWVEKDQCWATVEKDWALFMTVEEDGVEREELIAFQSDDPADALSEACTSLAAIFGVPGKLWVK